MIVLTGARGFIGSCMLRKLNDASREDILIVDELQRPEKEANLSGKKYAKKIDRIAFVQQPRKYAPRAEMVIHLGARTDTTETDVCVFDELNLEYSRQIWQWCVSENIPLIYASSAATYGKGEHGFRDDHDLVYRLKPLNPYGVSKNEFDKWVLNQTRFPPFWAGLKFFNVYGPNEYHKGRMASVVWHAYQQIRKTGGVRLFRSHHPAYKDGEQKRDFIYVKDVVDIIYWMMNTRPESGLYNVGTGMARSFLDLVTAIFDTLDMKPEITFIDTPEDIRENYQYYTKADITKLRHAGYSAPFFSLEAGIRDYIEGYLSLGGNF